MRDTSAYHDAEGRRLPSVTEILQIAGMSDLDGIPERHLERARERGVDLHAWLDGIDSGLLDASDDPPEQIASRVRAYLRFLDETGAKVLRSEFVVRHEALRYVGTADRLLEIPGRPGRILADLKATAKLEPEVGLQTMGYALALGEADPPVPARAAIWLRADGTYRFERFDKATDRHDWVAAVRVAHWRLAHGRVRLEDLDR